MVRQRAGQDLLSDRATEQRIPPSRRTLEGERKEVTILCCDGVESARLAWGLDPEARHQRMEWALQLMAEAVHCCEGTANQFLGESPMTRFGTPLALFQAQAVLAHVSA
ncbi:MAG TPA: hypothetical protein VNP04_25250 [Alphaproteobacteria bacterium]|nr:hypothetical protein [Alphaproteobacteria bacterium]